MPIADPKRYRDKTLAWTTWFNRQRVAELAPLVDAALIEQHRADPRGAKTPHCHALEQVLDFIHNQPTDGKSFAHAAVPYAEYRIGVMGARGEPPRIDRSATFASEHEAVHAVFLERLRTLGLLTNAGEDA